MTKEEKVAELINIRDNFNYTLAPREVFDDAIKALEQEFVLDKIKDEIEQITDTMGVSYDPYVSKFEMLRIIDKYKAESEEEK